MLMAAIERVLVDFFDANGLAAEQRGLEWTLVLSDGTELSLTEAAMAVEEMLRRNH